MATVGTVVSPPAGAADAPAAITTVISTERVPLDSGGVGMVSYRLRHDIHQTISPGQPLPGARVPLPPGTEGFHGEGATVGAWLGPHEAIGFRPNSLTVGDAFYTSRVHDHADFGNELPPAPNLEPGDRGDVAFASVPGPTAMPWRRDRGEATGILRWDAAVATHHLTSSFGGAAEEGDALLVRADVVARGGDVDARTMTAHTVPLVIDLPRIYGRGALGTCLFQWTDPYQSYIRALDVVVDPRAGKATLMAYIDGYIFETAEKTVGGTQVDEWHIPITGVIAIAPAEEDPLEMRMRASAPMSVSQTICLPDQEPVSYRASPGTTVIAGPDIGVRASGGTLQRLPGSPAPRSAGDPALLTTAVSDPVEARRAAPDETRDDAPVSEYQDLETVAAIDASLSEPVRIAADRGSLAFTLDPDLEGRGILAVRDLDRGADGKRLARTIAVPAVDLGAGPVPLTRSRLRTLRVHPTGLPGGWMTILHMLHRRSDSMHSSIESRTPGVSIQAVYELGDDRYALVGWNLDATDHELRRGGTSVMVVDLAGRTHAARALQYLELDAEAPPTLRGAVQTHELSTPLGRFGDTVQLGPTELEALGSEGTTQLHVLDGSRALTIDPSSDPARVLGAALDVYLVGPAEQHRFGFARQQLHARFRERPPSAAPEPPALGTPCGAPEVDDGPTPDAPPGHDVDEAWFDADASNLYATLRVRGLSDRSASGTANVYTVGWWHEHVGFRAVLRVLEDGRRTARLSAHTWVLTEQDLGPIAAELVPGDGGLIRFRIPKQTIGVRDDDLLRDSFARSEIYPNLLQTSAPVDLAPQQSVDRFGHGNDHEVGGCG